MKLLGIFLLLIGLTLTLLLRFGVAELGLAGLNLSGIGNMAGRSPVMLIPALGGVFIILGVVLYIIAERRRGGISGQRLAVKKRRENFITRPENLIYSDERGVAVTNYSFRVRQQIYPLADISWYGISSVPPDRKPAILLIGLGIFISSMARLRIIPYYMYEWFSPIQVYGYTLSQNDLVESIGIIFFVAGLISLIAAPTRYAVRIIMGGTIGMNTLTSRRKKYIIGVAEALKEGLKKLQTRPKKERRPMTVSQ